MAAREKRQHLITELITNHHIANQGDLAGLLAERGVEATQATLSRDLRELGVVKGPAGYAMPGSDSLVPGEAVEAGETPKSLASAVERYVTSVTPAGSLVVLKTGPGQAQLVAVEMDAHPPLGCLGTVAGDDTIFVATPSDLEAARLARRLAEMAGLSAADARPENGIGVGA